MGTSKIITPTGTLSYPNLAKPRAVQAGQKEKYGVALVFPPGADLDALKMAALAIATDKCGGLEKAKTMIKVGSIHWPFNSDWEKKGYPEGSTYINARSDNKPGACYAYPGEDGKPASMADADIEKELYPGAQVRLSVTAFWFDKGLKKGVSFGLNNVQKLGEGPRLDNRKEAREEFDADLNAKPADLASMGL